MSEFTLPHHHTSEKKVEKLHAELIKVEQFQRASEIFKQLSDPTRVRIFWLLCHDEECVINISAMLKMSSPAVSHHLRSLYDCGLLVSERRDREVYYRASETEEAKLLHKVVEQIMEMSCPKEQVDSEESPKEIVEKVHEYMMEHIPERITIEELSRHFLLNTTTLKKVFKETYGNSLAAHINEHRMELASKLLLETKDGIAEISKNVGYESQSRFTSAFKKFYNETPTEYRKNHKKE